MKDDQLRQHEVDKEAMLSEIRRVHANNEIVRATGLLNQFEEDQNRRKIDFNACKGALGRILQYRIRILRRISALENFDTYQAILDKEQYTAARSGDAAVALVPITKAECIDWLTPAVVDTMSYDAFKMDAVPEYGAPILSGVFNTYTTSDNEGDRK